MEKETKSDNTAGAVAPAATGSTPCRCWEDMEEKLEAKGYRFARKLSQLGIDRALNIGTVTRHLPIERADGKPLRRDDPKTVIMSHCPWCGQPFA